MLSLTFLCVVCLQLLQCDASAADSGEFRFVKTASYGVEAQGRPPSTYGYYGYAYPPNRRSCNTGFRPDDLGGCIDDDECRDNPLVLCGPNADCLNTVGSYFCRCRPGFKMNDHKCVDVDECNEGKDLCTKNENCVNEIGKYSCYCKAGYIRGDAGCQKIARKVPKYGYGPDYDKPGYYRGGQDGYGYGYGDPGYGGKGYGYGDSGYGYGDSGYGYGDSGYGYRHGYGDSGYGYGYGDPGYGYGGYGYRDSGHGGPPSNGPMNGGSKGFSGEYSHEYYVEGDRNSINYGYRADYAASKGGRNTGMGVNTTPSGDTQPQKK